MPPRSDSSRIPLQAALLLALVNILWAASASNAKVALGAIGPLTLSFFRFGPPALLLGVYLRLSRSTARIERADYGRLFFASLVGLALTYALLYTGMRGTTASETTLLIAAEPVILALVARLFLGEGLRREQGIGMAAGVLGVSLIILQGASVFAKATVALALVFECYAGVLNKRLTGKYPGMEVITAELGISAILLLPFVVWEVGQSPGGWTGFARLSWSVWASIGYVSLVCTLFCYSVWFGLMPRYHLSSMAGFIFIQPLVGPLIGAWLQGDRITAWTVAGAALVLIGVWLIASPKRSRSTLIPEPASAD